MDPRSNHLDPWVPTRALDSFDDSLREALFRRNDAGFILADLFFAPAFSNKGRNNSSPDRGAESHCGRPVLRTSDAFPIGVWGYTQALHPCFLLGGPERGEGGCGEAPVNVYWRSRVSSSSPAEEMYGAEHPAY